MLDYALPMASKHLWRANHITDLGREDLALSLYALAALLLVAGIAMILISQPRSRLALHHIFLSNPHCPPEEQERFSLATLILSSTFSVLFILWYKLQRVLPPSLSRPYFGEDAFFENMTAVTFMVSSILLVYAIRHMKRHGRQFPGRGNGRNLAGLYSILAAIFLFIAFEEISWGQRIIGASTPDLIENLNSKGEINLHNMFSSHFDMLYQLCAVTLLLCSLSAIWIYFRNSKRTFLKFALPHPSTIVFAVFIVIFCFPPLGRKGEIVEVLAACMAFFYSLRLVLLLNLDTVGS
jgi:hypothetical protein